MQSRRMRWAEFTACMGEKMHRLQNINSKMSMADLYISGRRHASERNGA
jgi:hypothetical protein